eukprot:8546346-Pyramimonas_sp.AAC.1
MSNSPEVLRAVRHAREPTGATPLPQIKKPNKNEDDDLNAPSWPEGSHRPDFTSTRSSRGRVQELDELVMQGVKDELTQNQDVDFIAK